MAGVPVFAELPSESAVLQMHSAEDLAEHPRLRIVAEAMRDLRTNLLFTDDSIRSIVITSPDGSHGKTTVAFSFAATLARSGTRTILVDADLRRGRIAELLEVERSPGLMDVLLGEAPLENAVRHTEGLDVLPSGRRSADPGELLTSEFPALLSRLSVEINRLENESDDILRLALKRLFERQNGDVLEVIKLKEIYEKLESAVDRCEDVANVIQAVVLRHT